MKNPGKYTDPNRLNGKSLYRMKQERSNDKKYSRPSYFKNTAKWASTYYGELYYRKQLNRF